MLREVVFGANDGLVSNVALVAGMAGATSNNELVLLAGLAGLVAGAISMALGAYVSTKSEREFREAEERRERYEVEHMRDQELAETRQIFRLKGITGPLLDEVVTAVSRDHEQWIQLMMREELGFAGEAPKPGFSAVIMGLAFAFAAAFPVLPFAFAGGMAGLGVSVGLTAFALFGIGAWRAALTGARVLPKAFEMVALAGLAVAASYGIGRLVGVGLG